jgi:hypothetical protein
VGLVATAAALAASMAVLAAAVLLDRRPWRPGKRNWIPLMIAALTASFVLARHLLALLTTVG